MCGTELMECLASVHRHRSPEHGSSATTVAAVISENLEVQKQKQAFPNTFMLHSHSVLQSLQVRENLFATQTQLSRQSLVLHLRAKNVKVNDDLQTL
jgi:hypothetical protein